MSHDNVTIVRRWFEEIWNHRREQTIDELLAAESICHAEDGPIRGAQEFKERQYVPFITAFPDLRIEVEAIVGQGDQVVVRWSAVGTHRGHGVGCPPTDQPVTLRGITWVIVRDGQMREGWQHSNIPEVIRRLAATSSP
jgi:steroid delta-isomerase-like uncharacterized protein